MKRKAMASILVTGGAGFIGSNFVRYLLKKTKNFKIVIFDKLTYSGNLLSLKDVLPDRRIQFVKGDVADAKGVFKLYRDFSPELIFHFAAESHVDRSIEGAEAFVQTNLVGTFRMLEGARHHFQRLEGVARKKFRFLGVSTDEVYGSLGKSGSFSENTPYDPHSPYSATKAGADHLVQAYSTTYGLPVLLTNCSNNYGPFQYPEKLIPLMILNALEGKPLPVYGDGGNIRDWLFVEDHCDALWRVMGRGKPGKKYNIGGDSERTNLQVIQSLCRELETLFPAARNPAFLKKGISRYGDLVTFVKDRPGHDRRYAINASKIKRELGWKPRSDFDSGMAKTIRWYFDNQDWCRKVQAGQYQRQRLGLLGGKK
jgi:dTDP-glucose 4,6-dehydratase